jgi:L-alanine-DL-glutamate epimerase-like enolase superfamily enzyme
VLRHIVLLSFLPQVDDAAIAGIDAAFRALPAQIALIRSFECGTDASPEGLGHDLALLGAVAHALEARSQATGMAIELQVDANGGWSLAGARSMVEPLAAHGVVLLEQPLAPLADAEADTAGFAALAPDCPMPLVADESCWNLADLVRLAPFVDGVNIKLLKSGGLSEGLLMAQAARRLGLGVMVGCYSDSALLNGAAAQLLPLVTWPDLDSHLNLIDDPFSGPPLIGGELHPGSGPGLGVGPASATAAASVGSSPPILSPQPTDAAP